MRNLSVPRMKLITGSLDRSQVKDVLDPMSFENREGDISDAIKGHLSMQKCCAIYLELSHCAVPNNIGQCS